MDEIYRKDLVVLPSILYILLQALRCGLGRVFALCEQNSWGSVALPIIGPGIVLSIPVKDAVNILTHEICEFLSRSTGCLQTICIAIMPNYAHSEEVSNLHIISPLCN